MKREGDMGRRSRREREEAMKREGDMRSQSRRERRSDEEGGRYGETE